MVNSSSRWDASTPWPPRLLSAGAEGATLAELARSYGVGKQEYDFETVTTKPPPRFSLRLLNNRDQPVTFNPGKYCIAASRRLRALLHCLGERPCSTILTPQQVRRSPRRRRRSGRKAGFRGGGGSRGGGRGGGGGGTGIRKPRRNTRRSTRRSSRR